MRFKRSRFSSCVLLHFCTFSIDIPPRNIQKVLPDQWNRTTEIRTIRYLLGTNRASRRNCLPLFCGRNILAIPFVTIFVSENTRIRFVRFRERECKQFPCLLRNHGLCLKNIHIFRGTLKSASIFDACTLSTESDMCANPIISSNFNLSRE